MQTRGVLKSLLIVVIVSCGLMVTLGNTDLSAFFVSTGTPLSPSLQTTDPDATPPINRAPCDGEATRTPTPTPSLIPSSEQTPTPTATTWGPDVLLQLSWPPNCATLHSSGLPAFRYEALGGPFVSYLTIYSPDNDIELRFRLEDGLTGQLTATPIVLPDGIYYWSVSSSRPSGYSRQSERWEFRIDTHCPCTDTLRPTATDTA